MCGCIILLECGVAIADKEREQVGPEHLGNVPPCSQVAVDEDEWSSASACDGSPCHHTPPVTDRTHTVGCESFIHPPEDPPSSVMCVHLKSALI